MSRIDKPIESDRRLVLARGWREKVGSDCLIGMGFYK